MEKVQQAEYGPGLLSITGRVLEPDSGRVL